MFILAKGMVSNSIWDPLQWNLWYERDSRGNNLSGEYEEFPYHPYL